MRLASAFTTLLAATTTTTTSTTAPPAYVPPHQSLISQWLADIRDFATQWLPVFFILVLGFTAFLLCRLMGSMPRTKPQNMATKGSSTTTWDDVVGVDEVRAELNEV